MHPSDYQWWQTHSGDYVLGLMSDADRLVFDRIMQADPDVKRLVVDWREQLQPMSAALTPIEPPEQILPSLLSSLPEQPVAGEYGANGSGAYVWKDNNESPKDGLFPLEGIDMEPTTMQQADEQTEVIADGPAFERLLENKQIELDTYRKSADGWRGFAGWMTVLCIGLIGVGVYMYQQMGSN